jgi:hypothetical protein
MLRLRLVVFATVVFIPSLAFAQQPQVDPRIASSALNALQAMIALRDAEIKALQEDATKRDSDWANYSKPLWQPPANVATAPTDK